jgi:hypothetical protein
VSIGNTVISSDRDSTQTLTQHEETKIEEQAEVQLHDEVQKAMDAKKNSAPEQAEEPSQPKEKSKFMDKPLLQHQRSTSNPPMLPPRRKDDRLSLQIPGSFDS